MADNLSEKKYQRLTLPMGKIKIPKFLYIILIILGVLILVVGVFYFYSKNNFKKTTIKPTKSSQVLDNKMTSGGSGGVTSQSNINNKLSNLEISKKLVNWLEKQRDERGVYSENEICENGICKGNIPSNRSGFSVMDGKVKLQKEIDQNIVDDLKKYVNKDIVQVIQSNYLLCNFLYDLYSYPNANEEVKSLTEKICFNVQYELANQKDWDSIYDTKNIINIDALLNQDLQKLENILVEKQATSSIITDDGDFNFNLVRKNGYFVSEFATRYKWGNKDEDYRGFLVSLDRFLDLYSDSKNEFNDGEGCGLAWGLIDMGEYKQMPELKKYGEMIYSKEVVEKDINKMTLRHTLTCGLLADRLNDKKMVNIFINKIITNFYDENKSCVGQQNKSGNIKPIINFYDVKDNGMFLILLNSLEKN
ncbi:MAG: hypothetical protein PHP97_03630 [Candidatus Shapirobacteria bacterium]|nr:hypothetical protein [Candidatus Shapirobacteria bacterium]MDD3002572.1 hypothetical protein [Candidatus Shapirobacteria bacterium]MDD4383059.1 hypothetical protein [Candidatus Shapirobacteria bacterium]